MTDKLENNLSPTDLEIPHLDVYAGEDRSGEDPGFLINYSHMYGYPITGQPPSTSGKR